MAKPDEYVVGIDIGSSKVGVLIGRRGERGDVEIVGKGVAANRGTRKGSIADVKKTVEALKKATEEAEMMAGVEVSRAYVGMAGTDVRCVNSRAVVSVARKDKGIARQDIDRVLEAARGAALPSDREVLHGIPQEFIIDDQGGISDPLGMQGQRLELRLHLVTGNCSRSKTLLTCVNRAGIEVVEMVFEPLATAEAVLTEDERELGVLLLDLGSGSTSYGVFCDGEVQHSAVLPIGATHFTNDLAMVLRTPFPEAERMKIEHGCCLPGLVGDDEGLSVKAVAGGPPKVVPRRQISEILKPRAEEMLDLIRRDLETYGLEDSLRAGVVLTGGGAQLDGLLEMAEEIFDCGVRYGLPRGLGGLVDVVRSPEWCTSSGLLLYALLAEERERQRGQAKGFGVGRVVAGIKSMFTDLV
jgi:cell division protein FtsA